MNQSILWNSVYVPTEDEDKIAAALKVIYTEAGYAAFNPFPGGTGTPKNITERVRMFVGPGEDGWTHIIGAPDVDLLKKLSDSLSTSLLYVWIGEEKSSVEVIGSGELSQFLRDGRSSTDIENALNAQYTPSDAPTGEVARLADEYGVDAGQADKMFQKAAKTVFKKLEKRTDGEAASMQDAAKQSLESGFSWGLASAQRVAAVMECLTIPQTWREPSFSDLAAAYQIACLLDIDEDAPLLPGDEAILDRVEYPLDYTPAYFAR